MTNRFREHIEDEPEEEERIELQAKGNEPESEHLFFKKLFTEGVVSKEAATRILPYLIFLSVLCMLYIANSHMAIKNIRKIDHLTKEVKELSWEYKSLKADLMFKSKLTEVARKVDTLGIKELTEPPKKLIIKDKQ